VTAGVLASARRGLWHGLACIATTTAAMWILERLWGRA